jgi:hypothetical protein
MSQWPTTDKENGEAGNIRNKIIGLSGGESGF